MTVSFELFGTVFFALLGRIFGAAVTDFFELFETVYFAFLGRFFEVLERPFSRFKTVLFQRSLSRSKTVLFHAVRTIFFAL